MRAPAAALAALLAAGVAAPAAARELWASEDGERTLELRVTGRELLTGTHGTDAEAFAAAAAADPARCLLAATFADCAGFDRVGEAGVVQSLTRLRIDLDARLHRALSARVIYDQELVGGRLDTLAGAAGAAVDADSFLGAEGTLAEGERVRWQHRLYRGFLRLETRRLDVVVGRQRIAWGVGRLWNPIDRLGTIPPLAIESDEIGGVDAVDVRLRFGGFHYLEGAYAPGARRDDAAWALRLHGVAWDTDLSVLGGVFREARVLGLDLARNLADAAVRVEVVHTDPGRDVFPVGAAAPTELDPFWQVVGSLDYTVSWGAGLYVLVEHLWNENALGFGAGKAGTLLALFESTPAPPAGAPPGLAGPFVTFGSGDRFGGSGVVTFAEHLTGFQLGYDVLPEVRADLLTLVDWVGGSVAVAPSLAYSPLASLDLRVGAQLFAGPRRSEYGGREHLGFLLVDVYF